MKQKIKLMIIVKSIDGGTGTFLLSMLRLNKYFPQIAEIKALVLEKPKYRKIAGKKGLYFLHNKAFYQESYAFTDIFSFIGEINWIRRSIITLKPHIVMSVDIHANLLTQINKILFFPSLKTILTTHTHIGKSFAEKTSYLNGIILRYIIKILYSKADILVSVSKDLSAYLNHYFHLEHIQTIYHGTLLQSRKKIARINGKTIVSVGRLNESKDFETLIKAFHMVHSLEKDSKLIIVGDGPLKKNLQRLAKKLTMSNEVIFKGWSNSVYKDLCQSDIFVLSSKREGFSYALLEAMSCGLPVVSTYTQFGPPEILSRGRYGIMVPEDDVNYMAHALLKLLRSRVFYRKMALKSIERSSFFSEFRMLEQYKHIFKKLMRI